MLACALLADRARDVATGSAGDRRRPHWYESRPHRDRVNEEVMTDPRNRRLAPLMQDQERRIFESARMSTAGFKVLVKA